MATLTVLAAGGATVPASGSYTAIGLAQVQAIFDSASIPGGAGVFVLDPAHPTIPSLANGVLIVPNTVTQPLNLTIPSGYAAVILGRGTNATVTATDPATRIVSGGALDFAGAAALVDASAGTGTINDSAANALIEIGGGAYSVTAAGAGSVVRVDNGALDSIVAGDNVSLDLGNGGTPGGTYYELYQYAASVSSATVKTGHADAVTVNGNGYLLVDNRAGAGATTISALTGSSTVFAGTGDLYLGRGGTASTEFIGTGATQTVFGGGGRDTVFGQAGDIVYNQGSGPYSYFIAGSGNATVNAAGVGAIFGGPGHTLVNLGQSNDVFVGRNGDDTVSGGASIATVFGGSGETAHLVGTQVAYVVPLGTNETMDASRTYGGTNFFAMGSEGNVTLVGNATAGISDTFQVISIAGAHLPHTVDIQNWHTGDGLFLSGYGAADLAVLDATINSGGTAFTLSDGTTVRFEGPHPTQASGSVAY